MIREVNLIGHLPLFIQGYREMQGIMNAENPEFQLVEDASETIKDNAFVQSADEASIKRFEKMLNMTTSENLNIDDRRNAVLARYTNDVNYNSSNVKYQLNKLLGYSSYTWEESYHEYTLKICIDLSKKHLLDEVVALLKEAVPANIVVDCTLEYNRHINLNHPHYILAQFTHQELCAEVIRTLTFSECENLANYTVEDLEEISCVNLYLHGMRKVE